MTDLEAVLLRVSRRTFLDTAIEDEKLQKIDEMIPVLNADSGLNFLRIMDCDDVFPFVKSYGIFSGVKGVIALKGDPSIVNFKEKIGYFGERLVLDIVKMGLATCWVGVSFNAESSQLQAAEGEEVLCVIPIGYSQEEKTLRETLVYKISHRKTRSIEDMMMCDSEPPLWFLNGINAVQRAPTAYNLQKPVFKWMGGIVSGSVEERSKHDLVDLGICKLHFEIGSEAGKFEFGNGGRFNKS